MLKLADVRFGVLGPVTATRDGETIELGGGKPAGILALLLTEPGIGRSVDWLAHELYGGEPRATRIKTEVSALRRRLGDADHEVIRSVAGGYVADVAREDVDAWRFEDEVAAARHLAATDPVAARDRLAEALTSWRSETPFLGVASTERLDQVARQLTELRLGALGDRVELDLRHGRHRAVIGELEALTVAHPEHERFWRLRMEALYRDDRAPEALRIGHGAEEVAAELGIELSDEYRSVRDRIVVQDPQLRDAPAEGPGACPYRGLAPFQPEDADVYVGRERLLERLVQRVRASRFVCVVGMSGSGKSSLLRAGLVPRARRTANTRLVFVPAPGANPVEALAAAAGTDLASVGAPGRLATALAAAAPDVERFVVVVDQLEEVFTLASDDERDRFCRALVGLTAQADLAVSVVVALRADFYGRLLETSDLGQLAANDQVAVTAPTPAELRRVVAEPAARAGVEVPDELTEAVVEACHDVTTALPLVSLAMAETWMHGEPGTLTLADYEAVGGVSGAIARKADAALAAVPRDQLPLVRRVLGALVVPGIGGAPDTARRVRLAELWHRPEDASAIIAVVSTLQDARLVVVDDDLAQLVHEALIREWPTLRRWLEEDHDLLRARSQLEADSLGWAEGGRDDGWLWHGTRLAEAEQVVARWPSLGAVHGEFVAASRRLDRRLRRQRRILAGVAAVVAVVLAAGLGFAASELLRSEADPLAEARPGADDVAEITVPDLAAFAIDRTPVSARRYLACLEDRPLACTAPRAGRGVDLFATDVLDEPIRYVTALDGQAFCAAVGGTLPTAAQWIAALTGGGSRPWPAWDDLVDPRIVDDDAGTAFDLTADDPNATPEGVRFLADGVKEWTRTPAGAPRPGDAVMDDMTTAVLTPGETPYETDPLVALQWEDFSRDLETAVSIGLPNVGFRCVYERGEDES